VTVDTDSGTDVTEYTVNAKMGHVVIDDDSADFIYGNGTEENPLGINDFEGATARKDGKPGVVPAPGIEDKDSFLKGDGSWANVDNTRECSTLEMDEWIDEVEYG